jgi:hypothetical protein
MIPMKEDALYIVEVDIDPARVAKVQHIDELVAPGEELWVDQQHLDGSSRTLSMHDFIVIAANSVFFDHNRPDSDIHGVIRRPPFEEPKAPQLPPQAMGS